MGGAPPDPPIHALPWFGEAVRRVAEDAELQQRRTPSPHRGAQSGSEADRCRLADALLHGESLRETLKIQWAWIDFEKKYLVLPASVTKNKRPHLVPLVQPAIELLEMVTGLAPNSPYVFPGPDDWIQKASTKVLEAAGIEDGRHHDTRRVVLTNMAQLGVLPHVADMVLNHAVKGAPRSRAYYDMDHYIPEK